MHRLKRWTLRVATLVFCTFLQCASITAHGQIALPGGPCLVKADKSWSDVEQWVWGRVCVGEIADLGKREGHEDHNLDPSIAKGWEKERWLSTEFLETVLLHDTYRGALPRQGLRIVGAKFSEPLNLENARLSHQLWLEQCRFEADVQLSDLRSTDSISFDKSAFTHDLDLSHAKIESSVNFRGARVSGTLDMNGATIGDSLFMNGDVKFADVDLAGVKVSGQLNLSSATVSGNLAMSPVFIGDSLFMDEGAKFAYVDLAGVKVGGQLSLNNATVSGTLDINTATIGEDLLMVEGEFDQAIDGSFIRIGQSLDLRGAENLPSLDLTGGHIGNELSLGSPGLVATWKDGARLTLRNVTIDTVQDTRDAWPQHLDLDGFQYQNLGGLEGEVNVAARGAKWYVDWIARDQPYTPYAYEQLASVLHQMGYWKIGNDVLYAGRERLRAITIKNGDYWRWAGQTILKYTIGYGYGGRYFRSLYWVLGFVLLGTLFLRLSGQDQVAVQDGKLPMKLGFFYSLDMLLPIIHLRQRHYDVDLKGIARYYFYFHQIMGYVLASFLIAGLAGLTK